MRRLVIGIGNAARGDDAAGRSAVRLLHGKVPQDVAVEEHDGEATALLAALADTSIAFLIDACASEAPAGSIHRFDVGAGETPRADSPVSSHGLGLAEALSLARALGQLPARCIVYAIEGQSFETGAGLSPSVTKAIGEVVRRVLIELAATPAVEGMAQCTKPR